VSRLKVTFADARIWRYVMAAVGKFIEMGSLKVNDNGLVFKAMDPSRTALVEFIIPRESFDEFDVDGEHLLPLNIDDLSKILKTAERDDRLTIEWSESTITLTFIRREVPRMFTLPLQTGIEVEEIPELSLELKNSYKIGGSTLYEGITGIEHVGDVLKIEGHENKLSIKSVSDVGEAEIIFDIESGTLVEADVNSPGFNVAYGMEYFSYIKQPVKIAEFAIIRADSDMPCQLELQLSQGARMNYYVAPRVE
jgi:proliferating cell nuclear antigen